jgi:hypothetical protein
MNKSENAILFDQTSNITEEFGNLSSHLRSEIERIYKPIIKTFYETSSELTGNNSFDETSNPG